MPTLARDTNAAYRSTDDTLPPGYELYQPDTLTYVLRPDGLMAGPWASDALGLGSATRYAWQHHNQRMRTVT